MGTSVWGKACQYHYGNNCLEKQAQPIMGKCVLKPLWEHVFRKSMPKPFEPLWEQAFGEKHVNTIMGTCPNRYGNMCFETIVGTGV